MATDSLSLSLSFFVSLSPCLLSSLLSSSYTRKPTCRPHVFNAQHDQHQIAQHQPCASAVLFSGPLPSRPLLFHSDIRGNDMYCNLSNSLTDSCQQGVFSPVWSQPWLRVHILRPIGTDFVNCLCSFFCNFRVIRASTGPKKTHGKRKGH